VKFYDEKEMGKVREALERTVLRWRGVTTREMMGCICYFYGSKFFALLITDAVVITKLPEEGRTRLTQEFGGKPFTMGGKAVKTWVSVPVKRPGDLTAIVPFVKTSYETAVKA